MRKRDSYRYAICSECRIKWQIPKTHKCGRYICPKCAFKRTMREDGANEWATKGEGQKDA